MLPELKDFYRQIRQDRLRIENQLYIAKEIEQMIAESDGKTWQPFPEKPVKPWLGLCRWHHTDERPEEFIYFCAAWNYTTGWREFGGSDEESVFDFIDEKKITILV